MKTRESLIANGILSEHNIDTYLQAHSLFESGERMVGITQATGTGKSYILAQFLYDECYRLQSKGFETNTEKPKPKKALVLSPTNILATQTAQTLMSVVGPNMKNVTVSTYINLLNATDEELEVQHFDVIVLDEFHRLGAEKWGPAVQRLLDANPNAKVLGLTATPVRYLDEARDMGEELFDGVIVQGPSLGDAIERGILPKPKYILGVYSYDETIKDIENEISACIDPKQKEELGQLLRVAKQGIQQLESTEQIISRNITDAEANLGGGYVNGKYIAYCTDIAHSQDVVKMLPELLGKTNKKIHIYTVNYKLNKEENQEQIYAFENDNSDAIKIMVAVNMFDEGLHINGVKGVFCFSNTTSPIRHLQRIGRSIDAGNKETTPLIFDLVNNIDCLKDFGKTCRSDSSNIEDPNVYTSPFASLPFNVDEKSLTLAEMLSKLKFLTPERLTPAQWIEVFDEFFTQNPNAVTIPHSAKFKSRKYGIQRIGEKINTLKKQYIFEQKIGSFSHPIIQWFITSGREQMLIRQSKALTTLTPEQWIEVFKEYFIANPNAKSIPKKEFNSINHGMQNVGLKLDVLKGSFNNGNGRPSQNEMVIINWLIANGKQNLLVLRKKEIKDLTPAQWIEVFTEYFSANPNAVTIPVGEKFTSKKYGEQNIDYKIKRLRYAYDNANGKLSVGETILVQWFLENGKQDLLHTQKMQTVSLSADAWIEIFSEYFAKNPNATTIKSGDSIFSQKYGEQKIGAKFNKLKQIYNNGKATLPENVDTTIIIQWFKETGQKDMLMLQKKEKNDLSTNEWIEVFDEFLTLHPHTTHIEQYTIFNSQRHGERAIGSKFNALKRLYDNANGSPSSHAKTIIDWFIRTGRKDLLMLQKQQCKNLSPNEWIEVFEEFFAQNPQTTSIPCKEQFTSTKYGVQNLGHKIETLKKHYNKQSNTPSNIIILIQWIVKNGYECLLTKTREVKESIAPEIWIEIFEEYFTANPNTNFISTNEQFNSLEYGNQSIGYKCRHLKEIYKDRKNKDALKNPIIKWLVENGHEEVILSEKFKKTRMSNGDDDQTM